ncbi:MAG: peptidoglycan-binding protein [Verrucomicrobiota bacterium]|jgi:lipoprotein-anchoring transpeptidase ErfK/SrfK|nr:peptidoglycan-binding protein [Verrucomicrobiota bacterium]
MFPPEPEKPWWHHLMWALPCMMATGLLGYWLNSPSAKEVEKIVEVPQIIYRTNTVTVSMPVTNPLPQVGSEITNLPSNTNNYFAQRGVPVRTNRTAALRIGLTDPNEAVRAAPGHDVAAIDFVARAAQTDFEVQVALDRLGFSPGSIDGLTGPQTKAALEAYQHCNGLPVTGIVDQATRNKLLLTAPALLERTVMPEDLARLHSLGLSWTEKSKQTALEFESVLEMFAEEHHCSPRYLMRLNPTVAWNEVTPGTKVKLPNTAMPRPQMKAELIHIQLSQRTLDVYDGATNLVARFPCSIATRMDRRPVGRLEITNVAEAADYTFDPARFPKSPEALAGGGKLTIPPGPNNPVGTTWMSLSRAGYGIHGTPDPEKIGRTTSLGCFRLSNWNAQHLVKMVRVGTVVLVAQ